MVTHSRAYDVARSDEDEVAEEEEHEGEESGEEARRLLVMDRRFVTLLFHSHPPVRSRHRSSPAPPPAPRRQCHRPPRPQSVQRLSSLHPRPGPAPTQAVEPPAARRRLCGSFLGFTDTFQSGLSLHLQRFLGFTNTFRSGAYSFTHSIYSPLSLSRALFTAPYSSSSRVYLVRLSFSCAEVPRLPSYSHDRAAILLLHSRRPGRLRVFPRVAPYFSCFAAASHSTFIPWGHPLSHSLSLSPANPSPRDPPRPAP
jgi:hypothetical protein